MKLYSETYKLDHVVSSVLPILLYIVLRPRARQRLATLITYILVVAKTVQASLVPSQNAVIYSRRTRLPLRKHTSYATGTSCSVLEELAMGSSVT